MATNTRKISLKHGKTTVTFCINPESLKISMPMVTKKKELLSGEHLEIGPPGLRSCTIDTFLPCGGRFGDASRQLDQLQKWRETGAILSAGISGMPAMLMAITSMTVTLKEGDPDPWVSVSLTEYRKIEAKKSKTRRSAKASTAISGNKGGGTYIVKKGDCLSRIAKKTYGSSSKWRAIYTANRKVIGKNPNLIFPGQKLTLPKL